MSSAHRNRPFGARPDEETRQAAERVLADRGLTKSAFVTACLRALASNPDQLLRVLKPHWPPPAVRGRPRAGTDSTTPPQP